jgi:EmrB/QacA subfamily drug resistance transporter
MLAVCCMSLFMVGLDNTIVNVGLPDIGRDLHSGVSGLQWTVAAYTIALAALLMFAGSLADRIGRRTIFQVGLSLFTLGSWLCSLAPGLGWLIGFRILQGVGGSMLNPAALGIITNTFTGRAERARAIGVWDGVFGLSMALGPVLGGVLVGTVGWRGIFWANIPVGLAAVSLTALFVPDSRAPRSRRADPVGQFLIIVMLGSLAYAIIEGPALGWRSAEIFGFFALAIAALAVLLAYEPRREEPIVDFRFFRSVPFAGANLSAVCAIAAMAGFLFLSTLYLQDVRGLSALQAGLAILPMPVVMALCAPLAGRMVAKRGPRIPLVIAGAAMTISSAALSRLTGSTEHLYLVVTYGLFGIGAGMVSPAITNGVMAGVPKAQAGMASGMNSSSRQLGQSLGVAIVGSVLAASIRGSMQDGFVRAAHAGWWILAGCGYAVLLLGLVCTTRWARGTAARLAEDDRLLDRARGKAAHHPPLDEGEQDEHRDGGHDGGAEQVLPVHGVLADERVQAHRERVVAAAGREGEGRDELVPRRDEGEDQRGHHAGHRQRERDPEQRPEPPAAVHHRGLLELGRDRGDVGVEDPDREREVEAGVDQDERPHGVEAEQPEVEELLVDADDQRGRLQHLRGQHEEQEAAAAAEPVPGRVVGGGQGDQQHEEGRAARDLQADPDGGGDAEGGSPHVGQVGPGEVARQVVRLVQLPLRAHRRDQHLEVGQQEHDRDDVGGGRDNRGAQRRQPPPLAGGGGRGRGLLAAGECTDGHVRLPPGGSTGSVAGRSGRSPRPG